MKDLTRPDPGLPELTLPTNIGREAKLAAISLLALAILGWFAQSLATPLVFAAYIAVAFAAARLIAAQQEQRWRRTAYFSYLGVNIVSFYYLQASGLVGILAAGNAANTDTAPLLMGFAFYMLQALGINGAIYRRQLPPLSFNRYMLCIAFCGAFLAGPLLNLTQLKAVQRLDKIGPSLTALADHVHLFVGGVLFKFVFANWLAQWVDLAEANSPLTVARSVLCFELQVYFDFAGYSLMMLCLGRTFGLPLYFNFQHPFVAKDIPEFWRRWHVGLGTWFKENLFMPLRETIGGRWSSKTLFPVAVFIASAAWHGPTRNFLMWGLYHGLAFVIAVNLLSRLTHLRAGRWLARFYVFVVVFYGRLLFMDSDFPRLMHKFTILGKFKMMGAEMRERLGDILGSLYTLTDLSYLPWDDVAILTLIIVALGYEVFAKSARAEGEPYRYFRPGFASILVFIITMILFQPLVRSGFVYGR